MVWGSDTKSQHYTLQYGVYYDTIIRLRLSFSVKLYIYLHLHALSLLYPHPLSVTIHSVTIHSTCDLTCT